MRMTLNEISQLVQGDVQGDPDCLIEGVGPIGDAKKGDISFAEKKETLTELDRTKASAVLVPCNVTEAPIPIIRVDNPRIAFAKLLRHFYPLPKPQPGVHPSAAIGENCQLGHGVSIGAGAVLGNNVILADSVVVHPLVVLGNDVTVGKDSVLYPHVSVLERCRIGRRVIIHAGTIIGSDGFGFVQETGQHLKIPQTGIVQIDDDVEMGAANTVDRATFGKTWIQKGVKTDNQVHIAHNVVIGEHTLLIAQAGISGSTTIGRHAIIAGQAGISDHLTIGNGVIIGPQTGIGQSIPEGKVMSGGTTGIEHMTWLRLQRALPRLPDMLKQIREMKKKISELEEKLASKH